MAPSTALRRAHIMTMTNTQPGGSRSGKVSVVILLVVLLGMCAAPTVGAAPTAKLGAMFIPEQLGQATTLEFSFSFTAPPGQVPPPLTQIQLRYPDNLGLGLSGLGLATCSAGTLEISGPSGCPVNSVMGYGAALTGIVLGTTIVSENAPITILRTKNQEGHLAVLFAAEGTTPVDTRIVFPGILLPAPAPFGGQVSVGVPLVPTLPGAPYISVIQLRATIGPQKVTYYEQAGERTLAYRPKGILLPAGCPHGGFPFAAQFSFLDSSVASARTAVRCPAHKARRHTKHH